jgi:hypothetical protein
MTDTGRFRKDDKLSQLHGLEEIQHGGTGRIEYDELGNAVWVPFGELDSAETLRRLLNNDALALTQDDGKAASQHVTQNLGGLKKGYDPYDSGMLVRKQWKKKKDLRALSNWIEEKKKFEGK